MRMITKEQLEALRSRYPAGTRVELLQMDDVQAPPIGTKALMRTRGGPRLSAPREPLRESTIPAASW